MELTSEQKQHIQQWISDGDKPADVQTKLEATFGIKLTFMEVRFLIDDLDLELVDKAAPPNQDLTNAADANQAVDANAELIADGPTAGGVSVEIDAVQRPGAVVSGSVNFGNGNAMQWQVDQMGQLGLIPDSSGYQPTQDELAEFQMALQKALQQKGF